jgi:hypothetical protein
VGVNYKIIKKYKNKKNGRCIYSGKLTEGKEVILADNKIIIEYLKKQGYYVSVKHGFISIEI